MKNLIVFLQRSVLIFVVVFMAACSKEEVAPTEITSLPYEALKILPNTGDESTTPPIFIPDVKLKSQAHVRYLTLYDAGMKNVISIKVATTDQTLLNSLNAETIEFVVLEKEVPPGAPYESVKNELQERASLQPIEIEVLETRLQKNIQYYGIRIAKPDFLSKGLYEFTYKNSNVRAVHVAGGPSNSRINKFSVLSSDCPDCEAFYLAPRISTVSSMISFVHNKKSNLILKWTGKLSEDVLILW